MVVEHSNYDRVNNNLDLIFYSDVLKPNRETR